jgi:hypothetical protein
VGERVVTTADADLTETSIGERSLVFLDCEGAEYVLADPVAFPALAAAIVVIELHEFFHRDVLDVVSERFAATHEVEVHGERPAGQAFERISHWADSEAEKLLDERRPEPMRWAVLLPRSQ